MTTFQREPAIKVARIAREVVEWDNSFSAISDGGETVTNPPLVPPSGIVAPALNAHYTLDDADITPNSLVLRRVSDSHEYVRGTDFLQEQHGFLNVAITPGTLLNATYLRGDYTVPGHRIQLNGVPLTQREFLNFIVGTTAIEDDAIDGATNVTLQGSTWSEPVMSGNPDSELVLDDEGDCIVVVF